MVVDEIAQDVGKIEVGHNVSQRSRQNGGVRRHASWSLPQRLPDAHVQQMNLTVVAIEQVAVPACGCLRRCSAQ
ncbi:hypothetical protein B1H26_24435 [Amycolatopsis sp. BJA-103]|nr:hypothetical protein BKN51_20810 [Amycolatopsis sp. BJA-103]PNE16419.1 hypothetical protein B1H26_24435 [Amycolatopsis sp. BJA-103]